MHGTRVQGLSLCPLHVRPCTRVLPALSCFSAFPTRAQPASNSDRPCPQLPPSRVQTQSAPAPARVLDSKTHAPRTNLLMSSFQPSSCSHLLRQASGRTASRRASGEPLQIPFPSQPPAPPPSNSASQIRLHTSRQSTLPHGPWPGGSPPPSHGHPPLGLDRHPQYPPSHLPSVHPTAARRYHPPSVRPLAALHTHTTATPSANGHDHQLVNFPRPNPLFQPHHHPDMT